MALKTPPLHAKGTFVLEAPWVTVADSLYEAIAIRSFADFVEVGQNAWELFYRDNGILVAKYEADKAAGASIITLVSPTRPTIHVPDTYITSYPDMGNVAYKSVVLSIALGSMPDGLDLTFLKDQVAGVVSDTIGVTATVLTHIAPATGVVTQDQHTLLEAARLAAIVNRKTDRARVIELQNANDGLHVKIALLEQFLKDNNLIPI